MGMTVVMMRNVGWNTAAAFGVALVSGTVAWAVNKAGHSFFGVQKDIKPSSSSLLIRQVCFLAGAAVGIYALQKTSIVNMAIDNTFVSGHALSVIMGLYLAATPIITSKETVTASVVYASLGSVALVAPFAAHYGQNALIPIIGIGAAVGSYLCL